MKLLQIEERSPDEIIIGERARSAGDVTSLMESIENVGQLTPILIDPNNVLIDGLHRLEAIKALNKPTVEVRVVDTENKDDHILLELLSNMDRREFLWYEKIALKAQLHELWKTQAEENNKKWGYRDTANKLKCSLGGLSTDLTLAEAMKVFPELREQATKSRAKDLYKQYGQQAMAIQRMNNLSDEEQERLQQLQSGNVEIVAPTKPVSKTDEEIPTLSEESVETETGANPASDIDVVYAAENYKTFLMKIPDASVGLVELDPPYAINFNEIYGKASGLESKTDDWSEDELYEFYLNYLSIIYQKMIDGSWCLIWPGKKHYMEINKLAKNVGFGIQQPGVWQKPGGGSTNRPQRILASNWEMYLLLRKGDAKFNVPSMPSAIQVATVSNGNRIHQWEKPVELYDHFLKGLGKPGSIFLSLFAGSGNCLIAAAKARMIPIGCDKSQKYIPEFYTRLNNYVNASVKVSP